MAKAKKRVSVGRTLNEVSFKQHDKREVIGGLREETALAAILRASSRVSSLAADRRPDSFSK
jgi:hypothetical protein